MKPAYYSKTGKKTSKKIKIPEQFGEPYNPDIIRRAVLAEQSLQYQPQGRDRKAGLKHSTRWYKRRRKSWRTTYGHGISRTPRKVHARMGGGWMGVMRFRTYRGAEVPHAVGGRRAHPPKAEKKIVKKINKKEHDKAIRSAMNATTKQEVVKQRGHETTQAFIIIDSKAENIKKTREVHDLLQKIGLREELERAKNKTVRSGRGTMRGRKYKRTVGPLIVVSDEDAMLNKSARNIPGVDVTPVEELSAELLAPGTHAGRLTVWTEAALKKMREEELYK